MKKSTEYVKIKEIYTGGVTVMFNKLYDNCFKTELNTKIIAVQEDKGLYWHACKDTIFYVGNDNMDSDIGMMDNHMVLGLKKKDGTSIS